MKPTRQSTNIVEGMDKLSLGGKNDYKDYKGKPQSTHSIGAPAHSQKPQVVQNSQPPQNSQSNSQIVNVNNGNNHGNNHGKSPMSAPPPAVDLGKNNNAQFVNNTGKNSFLIF